MPEWVQLSNDIFVNLSQIHAIVFVTNGETNGARIYLAGEILNLGKDEAELLRKMLESKGGDVDPKSRKVYSS